jgi:seryl-tRNA synthetase
MIGIGQKVEKGEERDSLRDKIKALEEELQEAEKSIKERDAVGEKALAAYQEEGSKLTCCCQCTSGFCDASQGRSRT